MAFASPRSQASATTARAASMRRRRGTALALAAALTLTIAPASGAWGEEPIDESQASVNTSEAPAVDGEQAPPSEELSPEPDPSPEIEDPGSVSPVVPDGEAEPQREDEKQDEQADREAPDAVGSDPEVTELALDVRVKADGTPSWDDDSDAGNDSGPQNGVVRVNDTVTYEVEYAVPSGSAENAAFSITFPKGMELTELPGYCLESGSSITPETAGEPGIPLTAESVEELEEQTLVCNRGKIASGVDIVEVTAKVLNLAHQGQELRLQSAELAADGVEALALDPARLPSVRASARLMWDISKNGAALTENSGYNYGPHNAQCPWETTQTCKVNTFPVLISAQSGGKGAMPAVGDITYSEDLSPEAMYPTLDPEQHAAMNADLEKYGSRISATQLSYAQPGNKTGAPDSGSEMTAVNSVRDSGTQRVEQAGPGAPADITISGADLSLREFPRQAMRPTGSALPGNAAIAVSLAVNVYTPAATIRDFGVESEDKNTWTLLTYNSVADFEVRGFDPKGDVQTSEDQPGPDAARLPEGVAGTVNWNDYRTTTPKVELGGTFRKYFMGLPGAAGNMSPIEFSPGHAVYGEGPPGGATINSGGITVAPTQTFTSLMFFRGTRSDAPAPVSVVGCDAWDNETLNLQALDVPGVSGSGGTGGMQRIPSNGAAVWASGYNNVPGKYFATEASELPVMEFQYSPLPGESGSATQCGEGEGPWYDSPTDPALGNNPALAAQGTYTGVSRVRAFAVLPEPVSNNGNLSDGVYLAASIGLRVADTNLPTGTKLPNYGGVKMVVGEELDAEGILAHSNSWSKNTYNPENHVGGGGDRVVLTHAQARIEKLVRKGEAGEFSVTPPQTTGDDLVQYQLRPSLTSGASTSGVQRDLWVEECLPASQIYRSATTVPTLVVPGVTAETMPADAKRTDCANGDTYARWEFPGHEVNTPVEPIVMTVSVNPNAEDGAYVNTAVVWAQDDASTLRQRTDEAPIRIANIRGFRITKLPLTPVVQVNAEEQETHELNEWSVRLSNRLPENGVTPTDPDVIDVLPTQGALGSDFKGTFVFDSLEITEGSDADTEVQASYTKSSDPQENPLDGSNSATGATVWCDAPVGGAVRSGKGVNADCPANAAEITAVRAQRAGPFATDSAIEFTVRMLAIGNRDGDVYVNRASGHAQGFMTVVRSLEAPEVAVASSLGDLAWWDFNRNGIQDDWQGAPEQPATGIPVRLTGSDDLGNPVDRATKTAEDGSYAFTNLRSAGPDGYSVAFEQPEGVTFTEPGAGEDPKRDSDADPETGVAAGVMLGRGATDLSLDAGLLPEGSVQLNKSIAGAGSGEFAAADTLVFDAVCTFDPQSDGSALAEVLNQSISIEVNGAEAVTSEVFGPLPAYSTCVFTETDSGNADAAAEPVTVTVPWDTTTETSATAVASMTNFYSAGSVEVTKVVDGDPDAVAKSAESVFELLVTCQIEEEDAAGAAVRSTLYSGLVKVKGGQTKYLVGDDDEPRRLPLGATCFGEEVDTGGATIATVSHESFEKGVTVKSGTPDDLQVLTIEAVNTFTDDPDERPGGPRPGGPQTGGPLLPETPLNLVAPLLAVTGGTPFGGVMLIALGLLLIGGTLVAVRARRTRAARQVLNGSE